MERIGINIFASVSTSVELEEGETVEALKERYVDIYLHAAGERGYENKTDLGAQHTVITEAKSGQSMVMVDQGLLLALLETAKECTDLFAIYDDARGTSYPWDEINNHIQGMDALREIRK